MSKQSSVRNKTQAKASKEDCRLKEQTSLGKWDEEQIVTCFQEENNNVLHQSVLEAGKDFFFPKALQEIAGLDINGQWNPDSHFGKKRLFLHVGRMNALDSVFQNVRFSCGSKTAYDVVLNFYKSVFESNEHKFIEETLQKKDLIYILMFNQYSVQTHASKFEIEIQLIGALSFCLLPKEGLVFISYLGVHPGQFQLDKLKPKKETKKKTRNEKPTMHRTYYVGTFLICCVQKLLHLRRKVHTVAAQISTVRFGPLFFYKKNFFHVVKDDNDIVKLMKEKIPHILSQNDESLLYAVLSVPLYLVHPCWVENSNSNVYTIKQIIQNGIQYLLRTNQKDLNRIQQYRKEQHEIASKIIKFNGSETKQIKDDIGLIKEKELPYKGDNKEIEIFLKGSGTGQHDAVVEDLGQGEGEEEGSCFFLVYSQILTDTKERYMDVRYFFYYLYISISMMSNDSVVFDYDSCLSMEEDKKKSTKEMDGLLALQQNLFSTFEPIYDYYINAKSEVKKYRLEQIKEYIVEYPIPGAGIVDPSDIQQLFAALGNAILDGKFWGGNLEFMLMKSIFNITPSIFELSTMMKKPKKNGLRSWTASCSSSIESFNFIHRWFQIKFPEIPVLIGKVAESHFVLIKFTKNREIFDVDEEEDKKEEAKQVMKSIDQTVILLYEKLFDKTYSNEKEFVKEWISERTGKLASWKKDHRDSDEDMIAKPGFEIESFFHPFLSQKLAPLTVQCLDPLRHWDFRKDIKIGTDDVDYLNHHDVMRLRPDAWVATFNVMAYTRYLNKTKTNKDVFFLESSDLIYTCDRLAQTRYKVENIMKKFDHFLDEVRKHKSIIYSLFIHDNHFVSLEVDVEKDINDNLIRIHYADGLNPSNDEHPSFSRNGLDKWFLCLLYKSFISNEIEDIHDFLNKGIPKSIRVQYSAIPDREVQNDSVSCGIIVMRRMYVHSQSQHKLKDLPNINIFRLFILQQMLIVDESPALRFPKLAAGSQSILDDITEEVLITDIKLDAGNESVIKAKELHNESNPISISPVKTLQAAPTLDDGVDTVDEIEHAQPLQKTRTDEDSQSTSSSESDDDFMFGQLIEDNKGLRLEEDNDKKDAPSDDKQDILDDEELKEVVNFFDDSETFAVDELEFMEEILLQDENQENQIFKKTDIDQCVDEEVEDYNAKMEDEVSEDEWKFIENEISRRNTRINIKNIQEQEESKNKIQKQSKTANDSPEKQQSSVNKRMKSRPSMYAKLNEESKLLHSNLQTKSAKDASKNLTKKQKKEVEKRKNEFEERQKKLAYEVGTVEMKAFSIIDTVKVSYPAPDERNIDRLYNEDLDELLNIKQSGLSRTKRKNWEDHYFDESQKNHAAAVNALTNFLAERERSAYSDYVYARNEYNYAAKKKNPDLRLLKKMERIMIKKKSVWDLKKWEKQLKPLFHPRDSIYAIQCKTFLYKNNLIKRYYAAVEQDDGKKFVKEVTLDFLKQNLEPKYWVWFEQHDEEKGWLAFDGSEPIYYEMSENAIMKLRGVNKIYEFKFPDGDNEVLFTRALVFIKEDSDLDDPQVDHIEWAIKIKDFDEYHQVSEEELQTLVTEDRFAHLLREACEDAVSDVRHRELGKRMKLPKRRCVDVSDPMYKRDLVGDIEAPQIIYTDLIQRFPELVQKPIKYQTTSSQISKIRYCLVRKKFLGYQISDNTVIELPMWWVMKTFDQEFQAAVMEEAVKGRKRFFDVPVGDPCIVIPTMNISMNPVVYYQQAGESTCIFSSFASALKYLQYMDLVSFVLQLGDEILSDNKMFASRRMEALINAFKSSKQSKQFWKYYKVRKVNRSFDLFQNKPEIHKRDFLLITLQQKNNSQSHAVTIVDNFIFDSNLEKALPFTSDGINCCCEDSEFLGVAKGYWFVAMTKEYDFESASFPLIKIVSDEDCGNDHCGNDHIYKQVQIVSEEDYNLL